MTGGDGFRIEASDYTRTARRLRAEGDGKRLLRDMNAEFRDVLKPVMEDMRSRVMSLESRGSTESSSTLARAGEGVKRKVGESDQALADRIHRRAMSGRHGLRARVARSLRIITRTSGDVRISTNGSRMGAGAAGIPRGMDSPQGWRHPVFGRDTWVRQGASPPGWFLETADAAAPEAIRGAERVLDKYATYLANILNRPY